LLVTRWAVAAGVVLALGTLSTWRLLQEHAASRRLPATMSLAAEDINGDGKVDILDALALARSLQSRSGVTQTWDVNGDGVVDDRDVDVIARNAVAIGKA
jgi:hypothetical protein